MSKNTINPGDVVHLKSGGPRMTVEWAEDGRALCTWFDKADAKEKVFAIEQLELVSNSAS